MWPPQIVGHRNILTLTFKLKKTSCKQCGINHICTMMCLMKKRHSYSMELKLEQKNTQKKVRPPGSLNILKLNLFRVSKEFNRGNTTVVNHVVPSLQAPRNCTFSNLTLLKPNSKKFRFS